MYLQSVIDDAPDFTIFEELFSIRDSVRSEEHKVIYS
jgi:hypothetical protein